ncbi:MAG: DUF1871 family protein [Deltaproteobacteria bacterium]|nr:DUF1871 family protein [Deltaproteobacteria bacterium]
MPLQTTSDYNQAFALVREVISEWDPYCLLASGAPKDEFDHEIAELVGSIPRIRSESGAAQAISAIFGRAFDPVSFSPESCADVGRQLFDRLKVARFI